MALDPRGENRSYSGYANKKTGAGSYSNKSGNGPAVMGGSNSDDKRQRKQGEQVRLGNAKYDKNGAYVVIRKPKTKATTTPKIKTTMGIETDGYGVNRQSKLLKSVAPTNLAARNYGKFDNSTYQASVESNKNSTMPSILLSAIKNDKYRNDEVSYNQAYFAARLAGGASQAELKSEQDSIGMKKAYSGDRVITPDMQRKASDDLSRVTGSMATLQNGGVTKTVGDPYGFFGENQDTTYNYKGGPSIVTRANNPSLFGVGLGDKTSTTFVDGVAVAKKTGGNDLGKGAVVTPSTVPEDIRDNITIYDPKPDDTVDPRGIDEINEAIAKTTDPEELKSLYKRRLSLMRSNRTRTKYAGLLGEADTKRTNLMSIS